MKNWRKLFIVQLCMVLILSIAPINAISTYANSGEVAKEPTVSNEVASDTEQETEHINIENKFLFDEKTNTIVRYIGSETNVTIPEKVSHNNVDYPVLNIGDYAFAKNTDDNHVITEITLNENLVKIGVGAFKSEDIENLRIPASVEKIEEAAFLGNKIRNLEFVDGAKLKVIGNEAFEDNKIEEILLDKLNALETIGNNAFKNNEIASLTFPTTDTFTSIGSESFYGNYLSEVNVPNSITTYKEDVFADNGKYVIVKSESAAVVTQLKTGKFGSIKNPVSFYIKGVDTDGKVVVSTRLFSNDVYTPIDESEVLELEKPINIKGPKIPGYLSSSLQKDSLEKSFVEEHGNENNPYIFTYTRNANKPTINGLSLLRVNVGENIDYMTGVSATTSTNEPIDVRKIKYKPNDIDTSYPAIYKVTYEVTDDSGNKATSVRTIIVGNDIMKLETGKGWLMEDFTYSGGALMGFSALGYEKLKENKDVVLPSFNPTNLNNLEKITLIGYNAFENKGLLSVVLPEYVESIDNYAFYNNKLYNVALRDGITTIGRNTFSRNQISSITLPESISQIQDNAFSYNNLSTLVIPKNVTEIESNAFYNNKLESVLFSDNLTTIGSSAFSNNNLRSVDLKENITNIGDYAFSRNKIENVVIPNTVTSLGDGVFENNRITDYEFNAASISKIPNSFFENNKIKEAKIPSHITEIGNQAFKNNNITSLNIPGTVTDIGRDAFNTNYLLKNLVLNEGLINIHDNAFSNTDLSMEELVFPNSLQRIKNSAFYNPSTTAKLKKIKFNNGLLEIGNSAFYQDDIEEIYTGDELGKLPDTLTTLGDYAFYNNKLKTLKMPVNVEVVPAYFAANNLLSNVELSSNTTEIKSNAFYNNYIDTLDLKATTPKLKQIENYAFADNTTLKKVILPDSLTTLHDYAFAYDRNLSDVTLGSGLKTIGNRVFSDNYSLSSIIIPDGVTSIGEYAFNYAKLTEIDIPDSVTSIGRAAFYDNRLTRVKLPSNLETVEGYTFFSNLLTRVDIPASVTRVDEYAFFRNKIVNVNVPQNASLMTIANYAFSSNQIGKIVLPASVTEIGEEAFKSNPGDPLSPGIVRVEIKNGSDFANTDIKSNQYMSVNETPITVNSVEAGTGVYIKNSYTIWAKIGETLSIKGEANKAYQPTSDVATEIQVSETPQTVSIEYRKKTEFNPRSIQIDMQHSNSNKSKLGYGLIENYIDQHNWFVISLMITDESIISGEEPYLEIDFSNPNKSIFFDSENARRLSYETLNNYDSPVRLDANYRDIFKSSEFDFQKSVLRLYFKDGALRPNQSYEIGLRYMGVRNVPLNSILDLSGAVSFGVKSSEIPLATTDSKNRIGARHNRYLMPVRKTSTDLVTYPNTESVSRHNGRIYAKAPFVPEVKYVTYFEGSDGSYGNYDLSKIKIVDILPTYTRFNEQTNNIEVATATLDEDKSTNWKYVDDSENKKIEFTGNPTEVSNHHFYLKFDGIENNYRVNNSITYIGDLGTNGIKILNGTLNEANNKFKEPTIPYVTELQYSNISNNIGTTNFNTTIVFNNDGVPSKNDKTPRTRAIEVYKRTISFFSNYSSQFFPGNVRSYSWNFNGNNYNGYSFNYLSSPSNSVDNGSGYYISYMPNTLKYKEKDILYKIELIASRGNAKDLKYEDVKLDPALVYRSITIPKEFKTATLKLYTSDDATGNPVFEKVVYNDPYVLTKEQQDIVRSYSLSFNGELDDGSPFTTTSAKMEMVAGFKNPDEAIDFENRPYKTYSSTSKFNATMYFEGTQDTIFNPVTYKEEFAVTNSEDVLNSFSKRRVAPGDKNPLNPDEDSAVSEAQNNAYVELANGSRISFAYEFNVSGFFTNDFTDFVIYDKLPEGLEFIRFTPSEDFLKLVDGYNVEASNDATGRTIIKIKADRINFNGGTIPDTPDYKNIVVGKLDAVASAVIKNGNHTNYAYLSIKNIDSPSYVNVKNQLESKNDADLVETFKDEEYKSVLMGSASYDVTISTSVLGELVEKLDGTSIWTPFSIKIDNNGNYKYRIRMINQKNNAERDYTAYGTIPYNEDINTVPNLMGTFLPRGTNMVGRLDDGSNVVGKITLTGPITIADETKSDEGDDPYYQTFYTFENIENLQKIYPDNIVTNNSIWKTKEQVGSDWARVTAFKIVTRKPFAATSYDDYYLPIKAPDNPNYLFDNLPFASEFLEENGIKNNKIVFKFAMSPNPVTAIAGTTFFAAPRSSFTAGNRVEAYLESEKGSLTIDKRGFNASKEIGQRKTESDEEFFNRLTPLQDAEFELYMVGKENVDPQSTLISTTEKFAELNNLSENDRIKDINQILDKKIINSPVLSLTNGMLRSKLTTNEQGRATFTGLFKNRDYILVETRQPENYESPIYEKYHFISKDLFNENDNPTKNVINTTPLSMDIKPLTASIAFNKVDILNNPIPFTRFNLVKLKKDGSEDKRAYFNTKATNDSGFVKFTNIPLGTYKLTEVGPRGMLKPIEPIIFTTKSSYAENEPIIGDKDISDYNYDLEFKDPIPNNKARLDVYKLGIFDVNIQNLVNTDKLTSLKRTDGKVLKDVRFKIASEDRSYEKELTTDGFGKVRFDDLEVNKNYLITEVSELEGYSKYTDPFKVRVNEIGIVFINDVQSNYDYAVFPNLPKENTNRVDIKKVFKSDDGTIALRGASFTLYEVGDDGIIEIETKTTDENGDITFKDFGISSSQPVSKKYKVKEVVPPIGYLARSEFDFATNDTTFTYLNYEIENPKISLVVNKTDKDTKKPLSNATFTLYEISPNGNLMEVMENGRSVTKTTDVYGVAEFDFDKFDVSKSYAVKETTAPAGYSLSKEIYRFDLSGLSNTLTFDGRYEINVENEMKKGRISINKIDDVTREAIQGVEFELTNKATGEKLLGTTEANGGYTFANLNLGTYLLREKTQKAGYVANAAPMEINITADNLNVVKNITNRRNGTSLVLKKLLDVNPSDAVNEKNVPLENARFVLDRSIVNDYHFTNPTYANTDANGLITFNNLEVGYTYRLREVAPTSPITPAADIGAGGYKITNNTYFITPEIDTTGNVKIYYRLAGSRAKNEITGNLKVTNERVEPEKVTVTVNKTLNGGSLLNPMPEFRVKLKRGTSADNLTDVADSEQALLKLQNGTYQYIYRNLDYDVWDDVQNKWLPYIYDVEELEAEDFTPAITKNASSTQFNNVFDIVNTYTSKKISVKAKKEWVNGGNVTPETHLAVFRRINNEEFTLVQNTITTIESKNREDTEHIFANLDKTDVNGNVYEYKVEETDSLGKVVDKVDDYVKTLSFDEDTKTHVITNTYTPKKNKSLKVVKNWNGGGSEHIPVYFKLYKQIAGGKKEAVLDTDLSDNQKALKEMPSNKTEIIWEKLASTDENANPYTYMVEETDAVGESINLLAEYNKEGGEHYNDLKYSYSHDKEKDVTYKDEENLRIATVNNNFVVKNISIKARKEWVNGGETKPKTYLTLFRKIQGQNSEVVYRDETNKYTLTLEAGNKSREEVSFENLPYTDNAGNIYEYRVDETNEQGDVVESVEDYIKTVSFDTDTNTHVITNTYTAKTNKSLKVVKNWVNGGSNHTSIYFKLYKNVAGQEPVAVSDAELKDGQKSLKEMPNQTTEIVWTNLTATDENATPYTYTVKEVDGDGNPINLLATFNDKDSQHFNDLRYSYSHDPENDISYEDRENLRIATASNHFVIKNISIKAQKEWVNGGTTKPATYITLFRKIAGKEKEVVTISKIEDGNNLRNEVRFENLPYTNVNGNVYEYSVDETDSLGNVIDKLENYEKEVSYNNETDTYVIRNTYVSPKDKSLKVVKNWINGGTEHVSVFFKLYRHIEGQEEVEVLDSDLENNQKATKEMANKTNELVWNNLTATDENAVPYIYTVKEVDKDGNPIDLLSKYNDKNGDHYNDIRYSYVHNPNTDISYVENGNERQVNVNNHFVVKNISLVAKKHWIGGENLKPETHLTLYKKTKTSNEEVVKLDTGENYTIHLPAGENKTSEVRFENLPYTDINANEYTYLVRETDRDGNSFIPENHINNENIDGRNLMEITNTYVPTRGDVTFTKEWINGENIRPTIYFKLFRKTLDVEEAVDTKPLLVDEFEEKTANDKVLVTFKNIQLTNDSAVPYTFFVKETNDLGEELELKSYKVSFDEKEKILTNEYIPEKISIHVTKIWENIKEDRPSVKFKLFRSLDGEDSKVSILLNKNQISFDDSKEEIKEDTDEKLEFIDIPNTYDDEIKILIKDLEKTDIHGNKYTYFVREYDENGNEFKNEDFIVTYLDDNLSIKNTYTKLPSENKDETDEKVEEDKKEVPYTADRNNIFKYYYISSISAALLVAFALIRRKR